MFTKTDIALLIEESSIITDKRKKELLPKLDNWHQLVADSVILNNHLKAQLLVLLLFLSDTEIDECMLALKKGNETILTSLAKYMQEHPTKVDELEKEITNSQKTLRQAKEVLDQEDNAIQMKSIEDEFFSSDK